MLAGRRFKLSDQVHRFASGEHMHHSRIKNLPSRQRRPRAVMILGVVMSLGLTLTSTAAATEQQPVLTSATVTLSSPYDTHVCVDMHDRGLNTGCGLVHGTFALAGLETTDPATWYRTTVRFTVKADVGCAREGRLIGKPRTVEKVVSFRELSHRVGFTPTPDGVLTGSFFSSSTQVTPPRSCPGKSTPVLTRLQVDDLWLLVVPYQSEGPSWKYQLPNPDVWEGFVRTPVG
jgi:hypothetical protein